MTTIKRRRTLASLALTALGMLVLSACAGGNAAGDGGDGGDAGGEKEVLKIGFITPLTGPSGVFGIVTEEGAQLAVDQWNESGRLPYEVELVTEDDAGTPEAGVLAYQKLRDEGIDIISGTVNSSVAIGIGTAIGTDPDVLYMTAGAQTTVPLEEQTGNRIFGVQASGATLAEVNLNWIATEAKPAKVAVLVENTDFGISQRDMVEAAWTSGTPEVVMTETFDPTLTDFSSILAKVRDSGADGIFVGAASATVPANIFTQAQELGMDVQKFINAGLMSQTLLDAGGEALNGITSAGAYHYDLDTPENAAFVEAFRAAYDSDPADGESNGYEAIDLILKAVEASGSTDPQTIADAMHAQEWPSVYGTVAFDEIGSLVKPVQIITIEDQELVLLDTVPVEDQ